MEKTSIPRYVPYGPERESTLKHRRDLNRQIILPIVLATLAAVGLAILSGLAATTNSSSVSLWADISLIWLIIPMMFMALVIMALAIALVHSPRLLFLDEPTSGVDPNARRAFWDLIYDLAADGVTILVTTHYMDEAEYCGRVGVMRAGKLLAMDTPLALKANLVPGDVWEVYTPALLAGLNTLAAASGVLRSGLTGDHLRVIVEPVLGATELRNLFVQAGVGVTNMQRGEPTLEDVFLNLAKG